MNASTPRAARIATGAINVQKIIVVVDNAHVLLHDMSVTLMSNETTRSGKLSAILISCVVDIV